MEKYMMIDGNRVEFTNEKTMLAVILKAGIILPTFCYYSDLSLTAPAGCVWWKMRRGIS